MNKMTRKILITGGMGFIGKYLIRKILSETDAQIFIVDNLSSSVVSTDILQSNRVTFFEQEFETWEPINENFDQIYHLASPVGPLGVLKHKGVIAEQILGQLYKAARMAIDMNAKLLEISTSEVYGSHPENE